MLRQILELVNTLKKTKKHHTGYQLVKMQSTFS